MEPFTLLRAVAAPYYHADVDTDELIPHRFLRKPLAAGYGNFLFHDKRRGAGEREDPDFILNREAYRRAQILVSGPNFGCGSTREGAVYALRDYGIRALIAPSFADIFSANCIQNGVLPLTLSERDVRSLCDFLQAQPGAEITIDLPAQTVSTADATTYRFDLERSRKIRLVEGLDEIGITLKHSQDIERFEAAYRARLPWLAPARGTS
ncbi:MAG: 3-isopropylmalate dehydratase small subunit [Burkholderiales bacterium]|nr:3-isopropylmalate dehydratase small subunit [Burkholderiales bacterium]